MVRIDDVRVRDALAHFMPDSGATDEYCRGILVGIVSVAMSGGRPFEHAVRVVAAEMPYGASCRVLNELNVPKAWLADFKLALGQAGKRGGRR